MRVCICVYMYFYMYICVYMCIYIYVHIYKLMIYANKHVKRIFKKIMQRHSYENMKQLYNVAIK